METANVVEREIGMNINLNNLNKANGQKAKETIGLNIVLQAGSEALAEQIRSNPLANDLGHLLCLAMGDPKGCIPLRVTVGG